MSDGFWDLMITTAVLAAVSLAYIGWKAWTDRPPGHRDGEDEQQRQA